MIKVKKIFFFIIKSVLYLVILSTLVLFFYATFFYEPSPIERKISENQITKEEKELKEKEKELKVGQVQEKISTAIQDKTEIKQVKTTIKDGLFITVGNRAITKSDIIDEIKIILILNNESFSEDKREKLQEMAVKSAITRNIKQIEIYKYSFLEFSQQDFRNELTRLANSMNMNVDLETLKNIFSSNELDFSLLENQVKTELLWNSLIFHLYKNRLSINVEEIEEQLKLIQNKKELEEYLISEIIIKPVEKDKLESKINELKNRIKVEGFQNVAINLSISKTAIKGGDLGWLNENVISKKYLSQITKTPVGSISEPILLPKGILIFKVRDKRKITRNIEEEKNQLVNFEKTKILQMHSLSHYDKLERSVSIKFINE